MGRVKKSFNEKYNSPFAANMRELMKEYGVTQDTLAAKNRQNASDRLPIRER